jgi:hypothetical protein
MLRNHHEPIIAKSAKGKLHLIVILIFLFPRFRLHVSVILCCSLAHSSKQTLRQERNYHLETTFLYTEIQLSMVLHPKSHN